MPSPVEIHTKWGPYSAHAYCPPFQSALGGGCKTHTHTQSREMMIGRNGPLFDEQSSGIAASTHPTGWHCELAVRDSSTITAYVLCGLFARPSASGEL